jgi:hypothetical protein
MVNNPNQINFISEYHLSEIITDEKLQSFTNQVLSYNYKTKNLKLLQRIELYEPKKISVNFIEEIKWFPDKLNRLETQLNEINTCITNIKNLKVKCIKFSKKKNITKGDLEFFKKEINETNHSKKLHLLVKQISSSLSDFTSTSDNNKIDKSKRIWSVKIGDYPSLITQKETNLSSKNSITLPNWIDEGVQIVKVNFQPGVRSGHGVTQYWKKGKKHWKLLKEDLSWIS